MRYEQTPEDQFRESLAVEMGAVTALDFTEQLMLFEGCGMIYDHPGFVQASQVRTSVLRTSFINVVLTLDKLPGLQLKTWEEFVASNDLLSLMQEV